MVAQINLNFVVIFVALLSEVQLKLLINPELLSRKTIDYLFPKDLNIVRVRNLDQSRIQRGVQILDFVGLINRHGYPAEEHTVTTEDGYILKIHRIPDSPLSNNKRNKKVLYLQHGIIASSDNWVLFGPGKDLVFLLADQGYDVWLGNFRGTTYSRSHVTLSPLSREFWQFSFHEVGTRDLPAMIDYVLNHTKQEALYYIGHSMGTSVSLVLLSTRPEYNAKIKMAMLLAPIAFWNQLSPPLALLVNIAPQLKEFFERVRVYELFPLSAASIETRRIVCAPEAVIQVLCIIPLFLFGGSDPEQLNTTALPEIFSYYPTGTSVLTGLHYIQNMRENDFAYYKSNDSGQSKTVTRYDLSKIITPVSLIYGPNDVLASRPNVLELYVRLPNAILLEEIPYKLFSHLDFIWAIDAKALLYDRVIEILEKFEAKQSNSNIF